MNRIQTACFMLLASAFVLAALLVVELSQRTPANVAKADQVIARDAFTLLTAQVREGDEALFVLDNTSGTLIVYRLNVGKSQLEPAGGQRLDEIFGAAAPAGSGNDRRR